MVYILPYVEQATIFEQWDFSNSSGFTNAANELLIRSLVISSYVCPSAVVPLWSNNQNTKLAPTYAGIAGAINGIIPGYAETRNGSSGSGTLGAGGILFAMSKINFRDMLDGTSNVMAVSEHGDYLRDVAGAKFNRQSCQPYSFAMGGNGNLGDRQFNCTTIQYNINQKTGWPAGCSFGRDQRGFGQNIPLNSGHPGGVNVVLCDASVRFLGESTPLSLLGQLATRDDGNPLPSY